MPVLAEFYPISIRIQPKFMTKTIIIAATVLMAMVAGPGASRARAAELKAGDAAPDFELPGSDGKVYKLSEFKGKRAVVLAWFPKAFTGG